jgi:hypothetical protein
MKNIVPILIILACCSCASTTPDIHTQSDFARGYFNLRTIVADIHRCSAGVDTTLPREHEGILVAGFAMGTVSNANFNGSLGSDLQKQYPIGLVLASSPTLNVGDILKPNEGQSITVSFVGRTFAINYDDDGVFVRVTQLNIIRDEPNKMNADYCR